MPNNNCLIFIPWYTERDWKEVSRLTYGTPEYCGNYDKWVERCEKKVAGLKANGSVGKVEMPPNDGKMLYLK